MKPSAPSGTLSCSPVGAGGMTGCVGKLIDTAYAEKKQDPNIRFSQLIAEERARRLASIDQDAAEMQARVEQAEREYEIKQRALQDPEGGNGPGQLNVNVWTETAVRIVRHRPNSPPANFANNSQPSVMSGASSRFMPMTL